MGDTSPLGPGRPRPAGYPGRWEADVVLRDGATVHVRPIRPDDGDALVDLHRRLSPETLYWRFFSPLRELPAQLVDRFVTVDYHARMALVAVLGEEMIGVARYERLGAPGGDGPGGGPDRGGEAEVAFVVADAHQGRGVGTILLEHLAAAARQEGIGWFVAETLPGNRRMLGVFHDAGFGDERHLADGVVQVRLPIRETAASQAAAHERDRAAAARSVRRLLTPRSVAVIGASRRRGTLGHRLLRSLLDGEFNGPVYPVHPTAGHVAGVRAYPTVLDIPGDVDLAVVAVPAPAVPGVVDECARKPVGGLVVISSGFSEVGPAGAAVERQLVATARGHGMRLIGPNSLGVVNTDGEVRLNATFAAVPPPGRVGFVAQSGGLGVVILDELARRGLGVSTFVSAGNKADVSGNDLLAYWDEDPGTDVALLYIESFGNPRTFARVARRVSRRKPVVAVKSGRSAAGRRAAVTDRPAQDDRVVDALFRQAGVIRTDTLEELFDVAQVLATQPLPAGPRVGVVAASGGPGALAADACSAAGLEVVDLAAGAPPALPPDAGVDAFGAAVASALGRPDVDAVIALYTSPTAAPLAAVAAEVAAAQGPDPRKPVLVCALGRRGVLEVPGGGRSIPSFAFPEAAARALGHVARYRAWREQPAGSVRAFPGIDWAAVRAVVGDALSAPGGRWLSVAETRGLLEAAGIPSLPGEIATSAAEAAAAAGRLGYPVAVKADLGPASLRPPVRLALGGPGAVAAAFDSLAPGAGGTVVVQAMAARPGRLDLAAGVRQDPMFGPLVTLDLGWRGGEVSARRAQRALPLTDADAAALLVEVAGEEPPGVEPADRQATQEVLERLARLAEELPELAEVDLDPLIVGAGAATVAGGRVRAAPWRAHPELDLRRLR